MGPSSGETTVFLRHFVLVILCGWLSGMPGGMKLCILESSTRNNKYPSVAKTQLFLLMMGTVAWNMWRLRNILRINCAPSWLYLQDLVGSVCVLLDMWYYLSIIPKQLFWNQLSRHKIMVDYLVFCSCFCFVNFCYPKVTTPPYPLHFTNVLSQYMWKNKISVLQWPLSIPLATQTHLPLQDTQILTWWWPPEAETCRLIIKIPYISCNKLFSNSCLAFNLNYYKFIVLDVHTLLFSILTVDCCSLLITCELPE